jgi:hypothetical protein
MLLQRKRRVKSTVVAVRADASSAAISGAELTPGTVSAQTVKKEVRNVKGMGTALL